MATFTTNYLDKTGLKALLSRIAEMFNYLNKNVDSASDAAFTKVVYDSDAKAIYFYNTDGNTVGTVDATDFIKDGMLNTAELVDADAEGNEGTYLHLAWNTDAGIDDMYIDVASLIKVYTAGDGIDITDYVVSVKKSASSEDYLSVDEDGVAVIGIDDIKSDVATNASDIDTIESWISTSGVISEDDLDALILEVEDETSYGMADAMGVTA